MVSATTPLPTPLGPVGQVPPPHPQKRQNRSLPPNKLFSQAGWNPRPPQVAMGKCCIVALGISKKQLNNKWARESLFREPPLPKKKKKKSGSPFGFPFKTTKPGVPTPGQQDTTVPLGIASLRPKSPTRRPPHLHLRRRSRRLRWHRRRHPRTSLTRCLGARCPPSPDEGLPLSDPSGKGRGGYHQSSANAAWFLRGLEINGDHLTSGKSKASALGN